ncbi:hypothetical protein Bhyg_12302, partial [Pseudolycoriella hygida]
MAEKFDLLSIFGQDLMKYIDGIDFESLISLQPDQIKEAIPNVIHRIMFENRLKKYLKSIEIVSNERALDKDITELDLSGSSSYNRIDDPVFDDNFSVINVVSLNTTSSSTLVPQAINDPHNQLKKKLSIKTV